LLASGAEATGLRVDVRHLAEIEKLRDHALKTFGKVHVVCNNAGVAPPVASTWSLSDADWRWVVDVNFYGVLHGVRVFTPVLLEQGDEGHICNTASLAGWITNPYAAPYYATKFAVVALSESLYYELKLAGKPVGVSVLCPGFVKTRIHESARVRPAEAGAIPAPADAIQAGLAAAMAGMVEQGMSAEAFAERVFEAVRDDRFYVLTHPDLDVAIRARFENALERRNPDITKTLAGEFETGVVQ
jgi:NAD(P)-dependent dehydrogenase (short-subunit alcohol dehydrogenase family)